jgi:hypothetical protein
MTLKADKSALLVSFLGMILHDNRLDQRVVLPLLCKPPVSANHSHVPTALAAGIIFSNDGQAALVLSKLFIKQRVFSKEKCNHDLLDSC